MKNIMKNILESKIASGHRTGDHNGEVVSPKIEILGLTEDGQPYGYITAEIRRSATDGEATTTLWELTIPFGQYVRNKFDDVKFVGEDGKLYREAYKCDPENCNSVTSLKEILHTPAEISDKWEVVSTNPMGWGVDKKFCDAARVFPKRYEISFKGFPTLEEIDAKWEKMLQLGIKYLTVENDIVVVFTENDIIPFSEV